MDLNRDQINTLEALIHNAGIETLMTALIAGKRDCELEYLQERVAAFLADRKEQNND